MVPTSDVSNVFILELGKQDRFGGEGSLFVSELPVLIGSPFQDGSEVEEDHAVVASTGDLVDSQVLRLPVVVDFIVGEPVDELNVVDVLV